jgi:hypothetical protein
MKSFSVIVKQPGQDKTLLKSKSDFERAICLESEIPEIVIRDENVVKDEKSAKPRFCSTSEVGWDPPLLG